MLNDIVKPSLDHGWSKESCKTILKNFDGDDMNAHLGMAVVETAVISDFGKLLCISCYSLEGNSPLILTAHNVFKKN